MQVIEKVFAAVVLTACLLLLLRMLLGRRRRQRFDAGFRRAAAACERALASLTRRPSAHARAERVARDAIQRARRAAAAGEWDGNVYRPKSFKRKKRDLH